MSIENIKNTIVFGFDSAWTNKVKGAICYISFDADGNQNFCEPKLASFAEAADCILAKSNGFHFTLVAIDQPTIVKNQRGSRLVDRIAGSVIGFSGGGVQPANTSKESMFGPSAPIWEFKKSLEAKDDPLGAQVAGEGKYIIEVFPALSLTAWNPEFSERLGAPKYNPANKRRFNLDHWKAVNSTIENRSKALGLPEVKKWAGGAFQKNSPTKSDQDKLDAVICLLAGITWRIADPDETLLLGDSNSGFIAANVCNKTRMRLQSAIERTR